MVSPAYLSSWGPSVLGRVTFPITDNISGTVRLDYRVRRGVAVGLRLGYRLRKGQQQLCEAADLFPARREPILNRTSLPRGSIPTDRYRLSLAEPDELHGGHLRDDQRHQAERSVRPPGLLPVGVPDQSAAGQRRRA